MTEENSVREPHPMKHPACVSSAQRGDARAAWRTAENMLPPPSRWDRTPLTFAPVAHRIEQRFPKPRVQVRFLPGAFCAEGDASAAERLVWFSSQTRRCPTDSLMPRWSNGKTTDCQSVDGGSTPLRGLRPLPFWD